MGSLNLVLLIGAGNQEIIIAVENLSSFDFNITGTITFNEGDPIDIALLIPSNKQEKFLKIPFDRINDYPHFELQIDKFTTQGHENQYDLKIKPKPKHFAKARLVSNWGLSGKSYTLWTPKDDASDPINIPKITRKPSYQADDLAYIPLGNLTEMAGFGRELDLHASAIFKNPKSVSPEVIYQRQLSEFATFIDRALRMNIDRVFIIHGVGKGRLRKAIHQKLSSNPHVKEFVNEYHSKYGFGATEVIFQ